MMRVRTISLHGLAPTSDFVKYIQGGQEYAAAYINWTSTVDKQWTFGTNEASTEYADTDSRTEVDKSLCQPRVNSTISKTKDSYVTKSTVGMHSISPLLKIKLKEH